MRKSDKKIENNLRDCLTKVCDNALKKIVGFEWITHQVNFNRFPSSLKIVCVFDTNEHLRALLEANLKQSLVDEIRFALSEVDIKLKNIEKHIVFDTQEQCDAVHRGNWAKRLGS